MEKKTINTQEEARQYAIEWQWWVGGQNLSYGEMAEWEKIFLELGYRFNLISEFEENGII